jgi:hypothetical protein
MKKIFLIIIIIVSIINFLYTFGYQGEPMSQLEFLGRSYASLIFGVISLIILFRKKK